MKVLFGTDILIGYLLSTDYVDGIRLLFRWLDKTNTEKVVDFSSLTILKNLFLGSELKRLKGFKLLAIVPKPSIKTFEMRKEIQKLTPQEQGAAKTLLAHLNLLEANEVDYLVTENSLMYSMAKSMGLDARVYTIENFIEKCTIENRILDENRGVVVRKCLFGEISIKDPFLKDFIKDYKPEFLNWFERKKGDEVYISQTEDKELKALLKLKIEFEDENYADIIPHFNPAKRLKICSFKVDYNGEKLGERFIRIIFEKAIENKVDEIYVTIFNTSKIRKRLIDLIERWGFTKWGTKKSGNKRVMEEVYVRKMNGIISDEIRHNYPFHLKAKNAFIIPIHRIYCDRLLPEDTLPCCDLDIIPSKHAIRKVLVLHEYPEDIDKGSILFFYRLSSVVNDRSIVATGIVENVYHDFNNEQDFISRCRKRSTLSNEELSDCWKKTNGKPIVVEFLYLCSYEKLEITQRVLEDWGIITDTMRYQKPVRISDEQYQKLISQSKYESYININKA